MGKHLMMFLSNFAYNLKLKKRFELLTWMTKVAGTS